ncbi:MAG TPA: ABC transporter ATP-binding protein [Acidimicrobiia bacterium]|nr:ABC transporter ATP-binding protein [Acidimicrobiia bacterium]
MSDALLDVRHLTVRYGGICALDAVDITVEAGEVVALLGANGAGKTTLLRAISRIVEPSGGSVHFDGTDLSRVSAPKAVALGIAHSPEGRRVLARQTVRDNLLLGAWTRRDDDVQSDVDAAFARFPRLKERADQPAGSLSGGEQQMLAIARALMSRPRLLLLDEPSLGLAPKLVREIFAIIAELHGSGVTILLVEQNASLALQHADRGYVLDAGRMTLAGPAAELIADERVRQAYLG